MHKPTSATNINQADNNERFNEYNGDNQNQGGYPIVNIDGIQVFITIRKNHISIIIIICEWIWEKLALMHTIARDIFTITL